MMTIQTIKEKLKSIYNNKVLMPIIYALFGILLGFGVVSIINRCSNHSANDGVIDEHEYVDSNKTYHKVYYDKDIAELKKENKALYDSIKAYKNKVSYLLQFTYSKDYATGVVKTEADKDTTLQKIVEENELTAQTYEYNGEPSDTLQYTLKVNSYTEPLWYSLNFRTSDKFTIINKSTNGLNELSIDSEGNGDITNVTTFKKKEKSNIFNKVSFGPVVTYGYDFNQKKFGFGIGIGIGYNIWGKNK